jgi:hypothetical protein
MPPCRYFCDSWIYRQGGMDHCKVDYYHCYYPCDNFPDHRQARHLNFFVFYKTRRNWKGAEALKRYTETVLLLPFYPDAQFSFNQMYISEKL